MVADPVLTGKTIKNLVAEYGEDRFMEETAQPCYVTRRIVPNRSGVFRIPKKGD